MNKLGMEEFFSKLGQSLKDKQDAFSKDTYTPFLRNVIVDVVSPETREVGANDIILSRLDEISHRISRIDRPVKVFKSATPSPARGRNVANGEFEFDIPEDKFETFATDVSSWDEITAVLRTASGGGSSKGRVYYSGAESSWIIYERLEKAIRKYGGEMDVPF